MSAASGGPRVVLHVGLPKTGTSFLQNVLAANRQRLGERGVAVAARSRAEMFAAALRMSGRSYDWDPVGIEPGAAWTAVRDRALASRGTAVISSEWLCTAGPAAIATVLADLAGAEVHVVITLRDLVRQLPAEWQEGVKHGRLHSFEQFLSSVLGEQGNPRLRRRFWSAQDPLDVLDRWGTSLPPDRVHVVVCPPPGAPSSVLWERFATVLGVDPAGIELPGRDINTSLGHAEVEVLRRVNRRFPREGRERAYREVVKRYYASRVLTVDGSPRAQLPSSYVPSVAAVTESWQRGLAARGYDVVGDLAELVPRVPSESPAVDIGAAHLLGRSLDATGVLLEEIDRLRTENAMLRRRVRSPWERLRTRLAMTRRSASAPRPDRPDDLEAPEL